MNKLKTTFLRTHSTRPSDERRSLQFARKLNAAQLTAFDDPNSPNAIPSLRPDELCEMERIAYQTWWKDLDPFSIGHLDNEAMLKFVRGCCLPEVKLEQVHFPVSDLRSVLCILTNHHPMHIDSFTLPRWQDEWIG